MKRDLLISSKNNGSLSAREADLSKSREFVERISGHIIYLFEPYHTKNDYKPDSCKQLKLNESTRDYSIFQSIMEREIHLLNAISIFKCALIGDLAPAG